MKEEEKEINNQKEDKTPSAKEVSQGRRDALKAIVSVPVLGAMAYGVYRKKKAESSTRNAAEMSRFRTDVTPYSSPSPDAEVIRIGIIGFGIRGTQLMQGLGFATPEYVEDLIRLSKADPANTRYQDFMEQDDLRVMITAVCDIFDTYGEGAVIAGANIHREGVGGTLGPKPRRYRHYKELLAAPDVDAVVIASPDHWHGTMAMDAIRAGKHVYLEKPMTWTVPETYELRALARSNPQLVFQLGHQNRQIEAYERARQIIERGLLGKISLVETGTNRNDPNGAWVYPIHKDASPKTIDWEQFEGNPDRIKEYMDYMTSAGLLKYVGPESREKFSLERFFRWRCWWDYSTGLSGDLLTHEYDAMNQILHLGIPSSASSSGGVYFFKDGRTVPDVLQTVFEFRDKELTMLYSATLASQFSRSRKIMGHDATMEVGNTLKITVDPQSEQYRRQIDQGIVKLDEPFYTYLPGQSVDAVSTATERYFAERGLLYSFISGKRYNTTFLHLKEWLDCIRNGKQPSCGIDQGFEEAITAHMGTRAYLEGRTMYWDKDKEEITRE
ncbi:Oxidoreductase [Proteiniphilum saccharofermentans]|uniref:Oxidoreductase n=1 Tax=Proteiniphilum saccharofermentans TaxID=1642647 RepID=A0A1R3T349_9BACT|nr:Gfo/Idh/MocA family oxidoreductase [Proteiniphilum saccharofermentans]SCD20492.1 Oxidoreductase [Proteiniphilum saccharofermentans]